jgi:ribosomal protein S18 acetylase RimI-like enzyme
MFPGGDDERLSILAALALAPPRSYVHWSTFLVAEIDGVPVGTVAGYVPARTGSELFVGACRAVLGVDAAQARLATSEAWSRDYFTVYLPRDTLRVEWVYTDPEARGRRLSVALIAQLLENAKAQAITTAHVGTYLGNEPAIATYRRAGFEAFAECRHIDYERRFRAPGLVFLRRDV